MSDHRLLETLRNQAIARALGELEAALQTVYGVECQKLYDAIKESIQNIKNNW